MGSFIAIDKEPEYRTAEKCKEAMRKKAPTPGMENLIDYDDTECRCCGRLVPYLATAMIRVEDKTPTTVDISQSRGTKIDLCADCFYYGVRPKHVRFGKIEWNQEGSKIKKRANSATGTPW